MQGFRKRFYAIDDEASQGHLGTDGDMTTEDGSISPNVQKTHRFTTEDDPTPEHSVGVSVWGGRGKNSGRLRSIFTYEHYEVQGDVSYEISAFQ